MKRLALGLATLAALAASAVPASAHAWVQRCHTVEPCAVCYEEGPVAGCVPIR